MQFEYPDISDCIKKGGFKRIQTLYNQKYRKIFEDVYKDEGSINTKFDGTVSMYSKRQVPGIFDTVSGDDDMEMRFLNNIAEFDVDYAAAVNDSLFKFASKDIWNTNHIISSVYQLCHLHATKPHQVFHFEGITSPYVYYALPGTSFPLHIEDLALWSCNYNNGPGKKLWYVVPPSWYQFLKDSVESLLKIETCRHPIQHKNIFLNPEFFQKRGIPYTRVSNNNYTITFLLECNSNE